MSRSTLEFLTEGDWSLLLAKAKRLSYQPGEEIIKQGVPGKSIYIIRKGTVSIEVTTAGGPTEVAVLGPDEICGDIAFLLKDEIQKDRTSASVLAKTKVEADLVDAEEFRAACSLRSHRSAHASTVPSPSCSRAGCGRPLGSSPSFPKKKPCQVAEIAPKVFARGFGSP